MQVIIIRDIENKFVKVRVRVLFFCSDCFIIFHLYNTKTLFSVFPHYLKSDVFIPIVIVIYYLLEVGNPHNELGVRCVEEFPKNLNLLSAKHRSCARRHQNGGPLCCTCRSSLLRGIFF